MTTETQPAPTFLNIQGMTCASCQIHVQKALESVPGVTSASVNLMAHTAQVTSASPIDTTALITAVQNSGYKASLPTANPAEAANMATMDMEGSRLGLRTLSALIAGAIAMLLSMPLMMASNPATPANIPGAPSMTALSSWVGCKMLTPPPCAQHP